MTLPRRRGGKPGDRAVLAAAALKNLGDWAVLVAEAGKPNTAALFFCPLAGLFLKFGLYYFGFSARRFFDFDFESRTMGQSYFQGLRRETALYLSVPGLIFARFWRYFTIKKSLIR